MLSRDLKMEMLERLLRMEYFDVPFIMISDKEFHISTTRVGDNRTTRGIVKGQFVTSFDGVEIPAFGTTKRCCIQIKETMGANVKIALADMYAVSLKENRLFAINERSMSNKSAVEERVYEIVNTKVNDESKIKLIATSANAIPVDAMYYRPSDYAPSSIKKGTCYGVKARDKEDLLDFYEKFCHDIINKSALGLAIDSREPITKKDILKLAPRIGSMTGASISLGKCNVAVIEGTFDKDSLTDGIGFMSSEKAANSINFFAKVKYGIDLGLTAKDVEGLEIQARPGSAKTKITVTKKKHFKTIVNGKPLKHGDIDAADVLLDANGVKAEIEWENIVFEYLASSHVQSPASTSKQLLEKVFYSLVKEPEEKKRNALVKGFEKYILKKMLESFEEQAKKAEEREGNLSNDYIEEELGAINPSYPTVRRANRTDLANTFAKSIDKLRFKDTELDITVTLKPDVAAIFERKLLNANEICINDARYFGKKIIMIKYPAVGGEEYYSAKVVSPEKVIERAKALLDDGKLTDEQYEFLSDYYMHLRPGCAVLPAIRESIDTCAGLDFDFDHASIYCGEKIVKALWRKEQNVNITKDKEKASKKGLIKINKVTEDLAVEKWTITANAFRYYTNMGNQSIGSITNASESCLLALIEALLGNMTPCVSILKAWRNRAGKNNVTPRKYKGLEKDSDNVINLSPKQVAPLIESMHAIDLNCKEDIIKAFTDLFVVFRSYQERTIDSTKTAEEVKILVEVLVSAKGVQHVELITKEDADVPCIERVLKEKENLAVELKGIGIKSLYFSDVFSRLQDKLIIQANIAIEQLYEGNVTFESMDGKFVAAVEDTFLSMVNSRYFDNSLAAIKNGMSIYYTLMEEKRNVLENIDSLYNSDEAKTAKRRDINKSFDAKFKEIGIAMSAAYDTDYNNYCDIVGDENSIYVEFHKALFLFAASMLKDGRVTWRVNRTQQNLFPEYLKFMLSIAYRKNELIDNRSYVVQKLSVESLAKYYELEDLVYGYGHLRVDRGVCIDVRQSAQFAFRVSKDITGEVDLITEYNEEKQKDVIKAVYRKEILLSRECVAPGYAYSTFRIDVKKEEKLFSLINTETTIEKLKKKLGVDDLRIDDGESNSKDGKYRIVNVTTGSAYGKTAPAIIKLVTCK